ncbi:hypothetical protein FOZ63_018691, partial [Perkinsus olseni]
EREAVHGKLVSPFRVGALVVPQLRLRSCCKNIKQMWLIEPSRYYSVIPDMLGVHEDDASANDLQALRASVVDLEKKVLKAATTESSSSTPITRQDIGKWGSLVVQYTEALTTSLVVEGSSMPSYDVKMTKQRWEECRRLVEVLHAGLTQSRPCSRQCSQRTDNDDDGMGRGLAFVRSRYRMMSGRLIAPRNRQLLLPDQA